MDCLASVPISISLSANSSSLRCEYSCCTAVGIYPTSDGDDPKAYAVRVGVVRQRYELVPRRQLFVRSQQVWVNNLNSIPQFDKMPPPSP
jgi:hypothetical protein